MTQFKFSLLSIFLFCFSLVAVAQSPSRSGFPAPQESRSNLRTFPCGGDLIFEEKFRENALPMGWVSRDVDGQALDPRIDSSFQQGWQSIQDFKYPNNRAVASASWYVNDTVASDDWLISPAISVQNNTCLSWFAYSQDRYFPERYEVLISLDPPSGPDGILENVDTLMLVGQEGFFVNFRSVSLTEIANGKYKNQQAYIAFRHTSLNKFMLVLDDIRVAEVEDRDLGVFEVKEFDIAPGDSVFFEASLRNYGQDTIRIDTGLTVGYTINGGTAVRASIFDTTSISIAPNDTLRFSFPTAWTSGSSSDVYYICLFSEWNGDQDVANDTFCIRNGVGLDITNIDPLLSLSPLRLFPNPTTDQLFLEWSELPGVSIIEVIDLHGKLALPKVASSVGRHQLDVSILSPGFYVVRVRDHEGRQWSGKFVKE